ncbi:MAG TPA: type II toxin-antitoxin system RelE/ParE family toxin [Thermoanaerobaculia bacterium]
MRHGGYRIVYSIEDDRLLVIVIRVADRKEVYRRLGEARSRHSARPFGKRR